MSQPTPEPLTWTMQLGENDRELTLLQGICQMLDQFEGIHTRDKQSRQGTIRMLAYLTNRYPPISE